MCLFIICFSHAEPDSTSSIVCDKPALALGSLMNCTLTPRYQNRGFLFNASQFSFSDSTGNGKFTNLTYIGNNQFRVLYTAGQVVTDSVITANPGAFTTSFSGIF